MTQQLKLGTQVLNGGPTVEVGKDKVGFFFVMNISRSPVTVRLREHIGRWKYTLPGSPQLYLAVLTDPPQKPHP